MSKSTILIGVKPETKFKLSKIKKDMITDDEKGSYISNGEAIEYLLNFYFYYGDK